MRKILVIRVFNINLHFIELYEGLCHSIFIETISNQYHKKNYRLSAVS